MAPTTCWPPSAIFDAVPSLSAMPWNVLDAPPKKPAAAPAPLANAPRNAPGFLPFTALMPACTAPAVLEAKFAAVESVWNPLLAAMFASPPPRFAAAAPKPPMPPATAPTRPSQFLFLMAS